jgi:hypothetical protein
VHCWLANGSSVATLWLIFGHTLERNDNEPIRMLVMWIGLPGLTFIAGSMILHPMFQPTLPFAGLAASSLLIA